MPADSAELVTETLAAVATYVLRSGEAVHVPGVGSFVKRTRKARNVANPATGAPLWLPACESLGLRPSKHAKRRASP